MTIITNSLIDSLNKVQFVVKCVRSGQGLFFQEEHLLNLFESLVLKQCF